MAESGVTRGGCLFLGRHSGDTDPARFSGLTAGRGSFANLQRRSFYSGSGQQPFVRSVNRPGLFARLLHCNIIHVATAKTVWSYRSAAPCAASWTFPP